MEITGPRSEATHATSLVCVHKLTENPDFDCNDGPINFKQL